MIIPAEEIAKATAAACGNDPGCVRALTINAAIESNYGRSLVGRPIKGQGYRPALGVWQISPANVDAWGGDPMDVYQAAQWTAEEYRRNKARYGEIGAMLAHHLGPGLTAKVIDENGRFDPARYAKIENADPNYPLLVQRASTVFSAGAPFDDDGINYMRGARPHPQLGSPPKELDLNQFVLAPDQSAPPASELAVTKQPAKQAAKPRNELTQSYQEAANQALPTVKLPAAESFAVLAKASGKTKIPRLDLPTPAVPAAPEPPEVPDVATLVAPSTRPIGSLPEGVASLYTGSNARSTPLWQRIRGLLD